MDFVPPSFFSTLYTNAYFYLLTFPPSGFLEGQLLSLRLNDFMVLDLVAWLVWNIFHLLLVYVNNPASLTAWVLDVILALLMRWRL